MDTLVQTLNAWGTGDQMVSFNAFAWIASNVLLAYIFVILLIFVVAYYILFDPKATTAGRMVFRFMVSLLGVMFLVFVATYLDPTPGRQWNVYPGDVLWWRPGLRLISYTYVAFSVTTLSVALFMRKFVPHKIKTSDKETIRVRKEK